MLKSYDEFAEFKKALNKNIESVCKMEIEEIIKQFNATGEVRGIPLILRIFPWIKEKYLSARPQSIKPEDLK